MGCRKERIKEKRKSSVIMTVRELINALNKVEDKSKSVVCWYFNKDVHYIQDDVYSVYLF